MRLFNSLLASLMLFFAAYVSPFFIKRALFLSWGVGLIPIGLFFIPSTNPTSWSIIGIGTFWAFFYSLLFNSSTKNKQGIWLALIGTISAAIIALSARWDSGVYILISIFSIGLLFANKEFLLKRYKLLISIALVSLPLLYFVISINLYRFGSAFRLPSSQEAPDDKPNAIVNLLMEVPSFIVGIFGGQAPDWVQRYGDLGRDFTYGAGWLEFNFPSITGITISLSIFALFFTGLVSIKLNRLMALLVLISAPILIMIYIRGVFGFAQGSFFQPRYFLPIALVALGVAFINENQKQRFLNKPQALILVVMIFIGEITSWLATITRYAISPLASITNFDQPISWWAFSNPMIFGKLEFFIINIIVAVLWIISTIYFWSLNTSNKNTKIN
jgi:hypothetical protein